MVYVILTDTTQQPSQALNSELVTPNPIVSSAMPKQSPASPEAQPIVSNVLLSNLPSLENMKDRGSDTLLTLKKMLSALREGLDMTKFGFPLLTDDQKDMLIRTILSLIVFLRLLQKGADTITLTSAFTVVISNLISPTQVLDYITVLFTSLSEELRDIWESFSAGFTAGYASQSSDFSLSAILSSFFLRGKNGMKKLDTVLQDRLMVAIQLFMTKVVGVWFTIQSGFTPKDMNMETLTDLVTNTYAALHDSTDIIDMIYSSITCVAENWNELIHGNIECLFLGKTESAKFEAVCAKIEGMYKLVNAKQADLLKKEYDHSYISFNQLVVDTLATGRKHIKTHTGAVLSVLKHTVTRLEVIRAELLLAIQNESLKPQPVGILLFGGSSVGKSTVQETLAKTILSAHDITPLPGMINSVNYADKFDSNTTSDSKVTLADDAGNAQSREDFSERIIDHINSQRRPINKAAVEDKGVHFYNNVGHIVSTNDHRMRNIVKSVCKESVYRRFTMHVHVKARPQYRKISQDENSGFSDQKTKDLTLAQRLDAYEFTIYEFKHMADGDDEPEVDIICGDQEAAKYVILDGMAFERVDLPENDTPSLELLKNYVFKRTKELHVQALKNLAAIQTLNDAVTCKGCGMTSTYCNCKLHAESQSNIVDKTTQWFGNVTTMTQSRLVSAHEDLTSSLKSKDPRSAISLAFKRVQIAQYAYSNQRECMNYILLSSWKYFSIMFWLVMATYYARDLCIGVLTTINFLLTCVAPFLWVRYILKKELKRIEAELVLRPNMLTFLVPESSVLRQDKAKTLFKWFSAVCGFYMVYKFFRTDYTTQDGVYEAETSNVPHTQWEYTKENQNQAPSMTLKAHSTTGNTLKDKVANNMAVVIVSTPLGQQQALSLPIKGNYYLVPTHCLPTSGTYDLTFYPQGVNNNAGKAKVPQVSSMDLSEIKGADYTIVRVTSSAPRWDLTPYLPLEAFSKRFGTYITQLPTGEMHQEKSVISRHTKLSVGASITTTIGVTITNAYRADLQSMTRQGQCGSAFVDETRGVILGFHSAGFKNTAIFSSLTLMDVEAALSKFEGGYQPTSQAVLDIGSENGYTLVKGDKWMKKQVENDEYNMEVEDHTWINHGIVMKDGQHLEEIPQSPFCKSDYLPAVVAAFGATLVGPPQEMKADYHKKKAAIDFNTPKQDFPSSVIQRAVEDYLSPILIKIVKMKETQPELYNEVRRELSVQEALDGIGEQGLTGINNASSVGWPFSGAKKKFMFKDPLDPDQPLMPRTFNEELYPLTERMAKIRSNAQAGVRSNFIVKTCSKTNELLPLSKKKCRPFQAMGTDVLVTCRQTFAPMVRFFGANKYLTECMLGINMKSHEAGEFRDFLTTFNEDMCIAGDFKAYDRNMSAQITSAAADIITRILEAFDYTDSQIKLSNALLTEIIYPHMNFYGQVFEMANSNPSGQPLTTHLNSIANSLYTRIIFFELCPDELDFRTGVKLGTYGDDNAMNVANHLRGKFTHTKMAAVYANKYGMTYTMDKKDAESTSYQNFEELGFLKQRIVYSGDYEAFVPLLDESSIVKSLHWQKKAKDCADPPHVQFASKVDSGLREASHYGRQYYDDYASKIKSIKDANSTALAAMVVPTYDAVVAKNKWAFHPEYSTPVDTELFESQAAPWPEVSSNHMFAWKTGRFIAYFTSGEIVWAVLPWKYVINKLPSSFHHLIGLQHEAVTIMDANELLSYQPAIGAGRFEVTPFSSRDSYLQELVLARNSLLVSRFIVFPSSLQSIYATHNKVCSAIQKVSLTTHVLPIRAAPITICVCGGTGLGKTNIALSLVKQVLSAIGETITANDSRICVLNETDSFQSEYTSDTLAVIFDDIANDVPATEKTNPLRKVLDYSNNVCKMALAPEADKKGIVAIRPKVVMATTNASPSINSGDQNANVELLSANCWSIAALCYYRRFDMIINVKPRIRRYPGINNEFANSIDWTSDGPDYWKFEIIKYDNQDGYKGKPHIEQTLNKYELMELARTIAISKHASQERFLTSATTTLDTPTCEHGIIHEHCKTCLTSSKQLTTIEEDEEFESQGAAYSTPVSEPAKESIKAKPTSDTDGNEQFYSQARAVDGIYSDVTSTPVTEYKHIMPMLKFYDIVQYVPLSIAFANVHIPYVKTYQGNVLHVKKINMFDERSSISKITKICISGTRSEDISHVSTLLRFFDIVDCNGFHYVATIQAWDYSISQGHDSSSMVMRKKDTNHHLYHP